jgi:hypothetical protein
MDDTGGEEGRLREGIISAGSQALAWEPFRSEAIASSMKWVGVIILYAS